MNELETIDRVKADLLARNIPLTGACGAFEITKRVAWELRDTGAGLLKKPAGNNCAGFADGVICYVNGPWAGKHFDILFDAGGENIPQWVLAGPFDTMRWAQPWQVDVPVSAVPPDPSLPAAQDVEFAVVNAKLDALRLQLDVNTEKIQSQINEVVQNAETTGKQYLPLLEKIGKFLP